MLGSDTVTMTFATRFRHLWLGKGSPGGVAWILRRQSFLEVTVRDIAWERPFSSGETDACRLRRAGPLATCVRIVQWISREINISRIAPHHKIAFPVTRVGHGGGGLAGFRNNRRGRSGGRGCGNEWGRGRHRADRCRGGTRYGGGYGSGCRHERRGGCHRVGRGCVGTRGIHRRDFLLVYLEVVICTRRPSSSDERSQSDGQSLHAFM